MQVFSTVPSVSVQYVVFLFLLIPVRRLLQKHKGELKEGLHQASGSGVERRSSFRGSKPCVLGLGSRLKPDCWSLSGH